MAQTTYTYSIALDTLNGKAVAGKLAEEIHASEVVISLKEVSTSGDDLNIIFHDSLDSPDQGTLDGLVAAHDGIPETTAQAVRIQETSMVERQLIVHGIRFTATLDDDTKYNIQYGEDRELQNIECYVKDQTDGDWVEVSVHMPDSSDFMISKFAETVYIPPDGRITPEPSFDTSTIPAGLIIRITYHSVATSGNQPVIICHLRTHK